MLDSQVLTTAIGLAGLFYLLAIATSGITEALSRLLELRARNLEATVAAWLQPTEPARGETFWRRLAGIRPVTPVPAEFLNTSVLVGLQHATGTVRLSYLSAKAFAEAVLEMRTTATLPAGTPAFRRIERLDQEVGGDLVRIRAGLEQWYDEAMQRLRAAYKRWSTQSVLVIGLILTVASNSSALALASRLWRDAALQSTAAALAARAAQGQDNTFDAAMTELGRFPIGWTGDPPGGPGWWLLHLLGWLVTALMISLGAPFWFDLLKRLVPLRGGQAPPPATEDPASATAALLSPAVPTPRAEDAPDTLRQLTNAVNPSRDAAPAARRPDATPAGSTPIEASALAERVDGDRIQHGEPGEDHRPPRPPGSPQG